MNKKLYIIAALLLVAIVAACQPAQPPAPPAQPQPPAQPAATQAPAQPAATTAPKPVTINNPPKSSDEVDAIDLMGKNVTVTYWHQRPQAQQEVLQAMLDDFNKTNPYGIKATAEIAGAAYPDVYNKVNAAIQAGMPLQEWSEIALAIGKKNRGANLLLRLRPWENSWKNCSRLPIFHCFGKAPWGSASGRI